MTRRTLEKKVSYMTLLNKSAPILIRADIAYSFEAIDMRDIAGADFKFAKTLTLDFFGAGMVDLPPGCAKRMKNSRRMQMVFFVFYGRVTVNVGTPPTKFSIGKGGQWQVPRGKQLPFESDLQWTFRGTFWICEVQHQLRLMFL